MIIITTTTISKNFDASSPDYVLDHTVGLTCVSGHPENPSVLAAGSFNGEVIIWDTSTGTPDVPIVMAFIII